MPESRSPEAQTGAESPSQRAPLLSYNVPQQVGYSGQNYIELRLAANDFIATARAIEQEDQA
jgi:hypothetical protein